MSNVNEAALRKQLSEATRMMVMAELLDYSGHLSARIPSTDQVLIQPRDLSRAGLTADEILIVDLEGRVLEGKGPAPSETAIYLGVYRAREDVQVVFHGHPPLAVLYTMVHAEMIAIRNFGYRFIGCPVHPDPTHIRTLEQGAAVAATLGKGKYCLLRGHGNVIACNTIPEAFLDSLEMEENVRGVINATALGALKPITPKEVEVLRPSFDKNTYRVAKTWNHYQDKARMAGYL